MKTLLLLCAICVGSLKLVAQERNHRSDTAKRQLPKYSIQLLLGTGKQHSTNGENYFAPSGAPIQYRNTDFLKSIRLAVLRSLPKNFYAGLELGYTYDYGQGLKVVRPKQGFSIGGDAGVGYYQVITLNANMYKSTHEWKQFSLRGTAGIGMQMLAGGDLVISETKHDGLPSNPNSFYYLPTQVNKTLTILFNIGVEVLRKFGGHSQIFAKFNGYYGPKRFVRESIRIESNATGESQIVTIDFTGTAALFFLGYQWSF